MFEQKNKRSLFFLFFTVFLDMLGFGILIPIIPQLFANPSSQFFLLSPETSIGFGYILLGFLVAVFPLGQFFSTSVMGQLSDFYGRKKLLIISIGATVIAYVLFALGIWWRNIPLLFISRFFAGITGGNIVVAQAAIVYWRQTFRPDFYCRTHPVITILVCCMSCIYKYSSYHFLF